MPGSVQKKVAVEWLCKPFDGLSANELYAILQLRASIFVVEQNCVYLDMDGKDQQGYHLMGLYKNELVAYTRLLPPGISYPEPSIGRVIVAKQLRAYGIGFELMQRSMEKTCGLFGRQPIRIGAQAHLKKFYESLGFKQCSDIYDEDGIPHIEMLHTDIDVVK